MEKKEKIPLAGQDWHIEITSESEKHISFLFIKNAPDFSSFTEEERKKIKNDIKDWGKWRKYKELKKDLEV